MSFPPVRTKVLEFSNMSQMTPGFSRLLKWNSCNANIVIFQQPFSMKFFYAFLCLLTIASIVIGQQQVPIRVIQSARDTGDRLTEKSPIYFTQSHLVSPNTIEGNLRCAPSDTSSHVIILTVNAGNTFQEIFGLVVLHRSIDMFCHFCPTTCSSKLRICILASTATTTRSAASHEQPRFQSGQLELR